MLTVTPIDFAEANAFVATLHRHHKPMPGCKFCIAVSDADGKVRGVVMVGRPVARNSDNGYTLEVNRCCTDGARNACSMLYGAAWRVAKALGYRRLMTYTLPAEGGASLRAAGWKLIGERGGGIGTCQAALASIPQKSCKDRNYYGKRYEAPPHHRGETMSTTLDKNANPKIPRHISRQYVFGARGFRREQREALRRTVAALDDLLLGSVYIPGGPEPLRAFRKYLLAVKRQMSRKEWGE